MFCVMLIDNNAKRWVFSILNSQMVSLCIHSVISMESTSFCAVINTLADQDGFSTISQMGQEGEYGFSVTTPALCCVNTHLAAYVILCKELSL